MSSVRDLVYMCIIAIQRLSESPRKTAYAGVCEREYVSLCEHVCLHVYESTYDECVCGCMCV
jgi:hypothetical protein